MNRQQLEIKLNEVTSSLFSEKGYVAFVDVFMALGYLDKKDYENCRKGNCRESRTGYSSWGKRKKVTLWFSKTGEKSIEETYATHFLKPNKKTKSAEQAHINCDCVSVK